MYSTYEIAPSTYSYVPMYDSLVTTATEYGYGTEQREVRSKK